ncbi:MAG: GDSL-type esterase/lipase family protein [Terriglobia bacterium]
MAGGAIRLQRLLGYVMAPVCWLMGVPLHQAVTAGASRARAGTHNPGKRYAARPWLWVPAYAGTTIACLLLAIVAAFARPIHIVAFGDSNTAGYLVSRAQAYPAQLQAALRKRGYDVTVANQGINGDTFAGALRRFDAAIAPGTDIALVEFGINDHRHGVSMTTIRARLTELIHALRKRGIQVMVIGSGGLDFSGAAKANGALYARWHLSPGKYRARDHAHYNAQGYAILVAQMLPQVEAVIARLKPR